MDAIAILFFVTTVLFGITSAPAFMPRDLENRINIRRYRRMQSLAKWLGIPAATMAMIGMVILAILLTN